MPNKNFALTIALRAIDKATGVIDKVTKKTEGLGKRVSGVGRKLTVGLALPIVGLGIAAERSFASFEKGMSNVSTLIDTNVESMDKMGDQVLAIGRRIGVPLDDLTSGLFDVRSAGISASKAMNVLEGSARLGVAGLGSTKQAADLVTSSLNAFQLEGAGAAKIFDQIFKATKFGKTTISELSVGFGAAAGTIAAAGIKVEDFLAATAAMTTTGLKATIAQVQLRAAVVALDKDTSKLRKVYKKLGVKTFTQLVKKTGSMGAAFVAVRKVVGGTSKDIGNLVGNVRAQAAIVSLTGAVMGKYNVALKDMRTGTNAVDTAFKKNNKTWAMTKQRAKNALAAIGIGIGKVMIPALEKAAGFVSGLATAFGDLDADTKTWIVTIGGITAVLGPVLAIVGKMIGVFGFLAKAIKLVAVAIRIMGAAMMANPVLAIIGLIAAAAITLTDSWGGVGKAFGVIWDVIVQVFKNAAAIIMGIVDGVMAAARAIKAAAQEVFGSVDVSALQDRAAVEAGTAVTQGSAIFRNIQESNLKADINVKVQGPAGTRIETRSDDEPRLSLTTGLQVGGGVE